MYIDSDQCEVNRTFVVSQGNFLGQSILKIHKYSRFFIYVLIYYGNYPATHAIEHVKHSIKQRRHIVYAV